MARGRGFRGDIDESFFFLFFFVRFLSFVSSSPERDGQYHVQLAVAFLACEEDRGGITVMPLRPIPHPQAWGVHLFFFALRHGSCVYLLPSHIFSR